MNPFAFAFLSLLTLWSFYTLYRFLTDDRGPHLPPRGGMGV